LYPIVLEGVVAADGYGLISADSHVVEPADLFAGRVPSGLADRVPRMVSDGDAVAWLVGDERIPLPATAGVGSGYRLGSPGGGVSSFDEVMPGLYEPSQRLRLQDVDSVDAEVLYPSPALWDAVLRLDDNDVRLACVRAYNDWLAEFCAASPGRLVGLGKVPSTGIEDACAEVRRCVEELGLRGMVLDAWPSGAPVAGTAGDDPFWEVVDGLGTPVSVHYAVGGNRESLPPSGIAPGLKPPMADAALPMVAAGVFDRFPNVRLVFSHGDAGWALHWLEFMDVNYVRHRHLSEYALADADAVPSDYVRRHSFFTFHHDRPAVKNRASFGATHLLWASHLPYEDSNFPDSREQAMRVTDQVPAAERADLLAGNVARLYRLPGFETGLPLEDLSSFRQLVHF
jgi:predicted TIM-barrel fold metal-dependent hydrolase